MPGGKYDSSKTRVKPVFDKLAARKDDWLSTLLTLPKHGHPDATIPSKTNLAFTSGNWGDRANAHASDNRIGSEMGMEPAKSLLAWMISNPTRLTQNKTSIALRKRLLDGDTETMRQALEQLERVRSGRAWHLFEGTTFPDAVIMTPDAIIVVEGKWTEAGATTDTTWLAGRHQMWRHIEAAWEIRGTRQAFGFFAVEDVDGRLPMKWEAAAIATCSDDALKSSFPHRSETERRAIASCFLGVTTWREICNQFEIDFASLPKTTDDLRTSSDDSVAR